MNGEQGMDWGRGGGQGYREIKKTIFGSMSGMGKKEDEERDIYNRETGAVGGGVGWFTC